MDWPEAGLEMALRLLKPMGARELVVVDVGAHYGESLGSLSDLCPCPFKYIGLEPNPEAFADFEAAAVKLRTNNRQVECLACAAGPRDGKTLFRMMRASAVSGILPAVDGLSERVPSGDHQVVSEIDVDVVTIETLANRCLLRKIDLLKIDTEGYDLEVLRGAEHLLKGQSVDAVLTEAFFVPYRVGQAFFWDIAVFMRNCGYHFVNLYDTRNTSQGRLYTGNALWVSAKAAQGNGFL